MTYELAKKLKEAGFPQKTKQAFYLNAGQNTGALVDTEVDYQNADEEFKQAKLVACPTLEELIEAVLEKNKETNSFLLKHIGRGGEHQWLAASYFGFRKPEYEVEAPTALEAVALLWLELIKSNE